MTDLLVVSQTLAEPLPGEFTPTSWQAPADMTYDEWLFVGDGLSLATKSIHWWLGDWVIAGEHQYGEKYAQAIDDTKFSLGTLKNDVWVASRIPWDHRRAELAWTHHYLVASYDLKTIDAILDKVSSRGWSTRKLTNILRRWNRIFRRDAARIGAVKWSKSDNTSFLPLPPTIDAQPDDDARTVWSTAPTDATYIDWRKVAKSEWRRKRFFQRECDRLALENRKLADENVQLLTLCIERDLAVDGHRSHVRTLNWND